MKSGQDETHCNASANQEFGAILEAALSRRSVLQGGLGLAALGFVGGPRELLAQSALIGFASVPLSGEDRVIVPQGYQAEVLYAWGDPVSSGPAWEYIYKFVSGGRFISADRAANFALLDSGTLYVARFNADGSGNWLELSYGTNGLDEAAGFGSQADVLINARGAGDKVGATKMDRPEWIAVNPRTHEVLRHAHQQHPARRRGKGSTRRRESAQDQRLRPHRALARGR